MQFRNKKWVT